MSESATPNQAPQSSTASPSTSPSIGVDTHPGHGSDGEEIELGDVLAPPLGEGEIGRLAHYRVLKELGRGGMGVVLLAEDTRLQRLAALKVMLPHYARSANARDRFLREARTAARVNHDHVVTIFQVDEERGFPFIAMEYLEGSSLDDYLKENGKPPLDLAIRIIRETAEGLQAAHAKGLIHRDIKPANLWLEGSKQRVKILDFGLARELQDDIHLTKSGAVLGTPAFMAPEQGLGAAVDARSDLFSLGVVFYRLCTGKHPFTGASMGALILCHATETPLPVRQHEPNLPDELERLIVRLLARLPADRPQTAGELIEQLDALRIAPGSLSIPVAIPIADGKSSERARDTTPFALTPSPADLANRADTWKTAKPAQRQSKALIYSLAALVLVMGGLFAFRELNKNQPESKIENRAQTLGPPGKNDNLAELSNRMIQTITPSKTGTHKDEPKTTEPISAEVLSIPPRPVPRQEEPKKVEPPVPPKKTAGTDVATTSPNPEPFQDDPKKVEPPKKVISEEILTIPPRPEPRKEEPKRIEPPVPPKKTIGTDIAKLPSKTDPGIDTPKKVEPPVPPKKKAPDIAKVEMPPAILKAPFTKLEALKARAVWAKYLHVPEHKQLDLSNKAHLELVLVPPGEFQMGSPETEKEREADREKQHRVVISKPFYMALTETTQEQYEAVMNDNPSFFKRRKVGADTAHFPVDDVSWDNAEAFCRKVGGRLPTEAQWEYACRAGTTTAFHFGDVLNGKDANCDGNHPYLTRSGPYLERTDAVKRYEPNAFGLYDMHGNVWEWCRDFYAPRTSDLAEKDPERTIRQGDNHRVLRGGSWDYFAKFCRSAYRYQNAPDSRLSGKGFRIIVLP